MRIVKNAEIIFVDTVEDLYPVDNFHGSFRPGEDRFIHVQAPSRVSPVLAAAQEVFDSDSVPVVVLSERILSSRDVIVREILEHGTIEGQRLPEGTVLVSSDAAPGLV